MPYRKHPRSHGGKTYFIAGAIKSPGALREYIQNTYGSAGFAPGGAIKRETLEKIASGKCPVCVGKTCTCPTKLTRQRARFAKLLRSFRK